MSDVTENLIVGVLSLYNSDDVVIVNNAIETIHSLVNGTETQYIEDYVLPLKRAANSMYKSEASKQTSVLGLSNPKGWQPLLVILREGLLTAPPETKEIAAIAMSQLIALSNEAGIYFIYFAFCLIVR